MGSGPDINYPAQPTYGEGMADAMKAQMEMLLGTGDFAEIFSDAGFDGAKLQDILREVEAPLRQESAQIDTDVLRQTLLGNQTKVVKDPETGKYGIPGAEVVNTKESDPNSRFQIVKTSGVTLFNDFANQGKQHKEYRTPKYEIIDTKTGGTTSYGGYRVDYYPGQNGGKILLFDKDGNRTDITDIGSDGISSLENYFAKNGAKEVSESYQQLSGIAKESGEDAAAQQFNFTNPNTGEPLREGEVVREGDGMIDLLGDRRNVQEFTTRDATQADVDAGLASEVGESITEASGNRMAGFDEQGNFLGLAALAEDIQRGNLSRQREADLADVERLSDRFQTVMEDYAPATTTGLQGARDLLEQQRENLTGVRTATEADVEAGLAANVGDTIQGEGSSPITVPKGSTYGGDVTASKMTAATVASPNTLSANTQFGGDLATGKIGEGDNTQDTLRSALLSDARTALGQGLTDREQANIANAARARQTMMGRTFDQSGAIAEAEARVAEDNARRMQNRSFAQSVLGQEAGIQQGDITRSMAQESEQAGLQQKADLAQAQMDQQANAFDADAAMRANIVNQAQQQQANQLDLGAKMDAERLNEQLRQQGLGNYINAVGNLAQIEDSYTLDPFAALLGRGAKDTLASGQDVFSQSSYGLESGPEFLNPESGLSFISNMATNDANMAAAEAAAKGSATAGLFSGIGSALGGLAGNTNVICWVAREVYGETNPSWMLFREWLIDDSPSWFRNLYKNYGERFAQWISDKPRIKSIIRKWMDSKIGGK